MYWGGGGGGGNFFPKKGGSVKNRRFFRFSTYKTENFSKRVPQKSGKSKKK